MPDPPDPLAVTLVVAPEDAGERLDRYVAGRLPEMSRSQVQRAIEEGRLTLNGALPAKAGVGLQGGDVVAVVAAGARPPGPHAAEAIPLTFVYSDAHIVVVDKPAGLVVHPAPGHASGTLVNALRWHFERLGEGGAADRPGIVHRIDKDTTGLLVVARTERALERLQAQFAARTTHRRYRAVAFGAKLDDAGTIETLYGRHPRDRKRFTSKTERGRRACTHWAVLSRGEALVLLELRLDTGRTHQIRVHLADTGHPIVADPVYGKPVPRTSGAGRMARELAAARRMPRLALHAAELGFDHPETGERLVFSSPDPPDLAALVEALLGPAR